MTIAQRIASLIAAACTVTVVMFPVAAEAARLVG
jgi:hypothetical protein